MLGLETYKQLDILNAVHNIKERNGDIEQFIKKNEHVFIDTGEFPRTYDIVLTQGRERISKLPAKVSKVIKDKLRQHLKELENEKELSTYDNGSSKVSNLIIREKSDGSLKI